MTLIEVLAATAMLALIASALIGLGSTVATSSTSGSPLNSQEQQRLDELRELKADEIETHLNPGEWLVRVESVNPTPDKPSPGEWVTISTEDGLLVVRWVPASQPEDDAPEGGR